MKKPNICHQREVRNLNGSFWYFDKKLRSKCFRKITYHSGQYWIYKSDRVNFHLVPTLKSNKIKELKVEGYIISISLFKVYIYIYIYIYIYTHTYTHFPPCSLHKAMVQFQRLGI